MHYSTESPLFWQTDSREMPLRPDHPEDFPLNDERHWFDMEYAGRHVKREKQPQSPADGAKGKNIIVLGSGSHPYSREYQRGMFEAAEQFSINLSYYDSQWDTDLQMIQIERAIQLKPDMIILSAENREASNEMIRKIYNAGIPLIASNFMPLDKSFPYLLGWTGPDDWGQFRLLSRRFAEEMNFKGSYAIVCHRKETSTYYARSWSAITELQKYAPEMKILAMDSTDLNREKTCLLVKKWLDQYGTELKGIISADDNVTQLGINEALREEKREDIIRVANGSTPTGIRLVQEGTLKAITFQLPEQDGALPIRVAVDWFNGLKTPLMNTLPIRLLDKSNISQLFSEPVDTTDTSPDILSQCVMECRSSDVFRYFRKVEQDFSRDSSMTMEYFRGYSIQVLSSLLNIVKALDLPAEEITGSYDTLFKKLFQQPSMEKTLGWLQEVALQIIHYLSRKRNRHTSLIQQIVDYAETHFAEPISLKTLAFRFNISSPYLGKLFREETGSSFPSWLNRQRMEEAEKLMYAGGLTASQIAIKVGYSNPNYFFSLFKKYKGKNPGDFMESIKES